MLRISSKASGFHLKFSNGWTISVQFGYYNYCNNNLDRLSSLETADGYAGSDNAEVAAWDSNERWYDFGTDTVKGYLNADEVSDFIHMIRNLEENYNETIK
jgi:hypothetical protein|tara:strand:+ start:806 stop:1108 length:303 start_codon:yes stop_codon:yes gene_type:complete